MITVSSIEQEYTAKGFLVIIAKDVENKTFRIEQDLKTGKTVYCAAKRVYGSVFQKNVIQPILKFKLQNK